MTTLEDTYKMTLAERIHEILWSDEAIPIRDCLLHSNVVQDFEDDPSAMRDWGFTVGLAFALTPPEPLEPSWSTSERALDVAFEVRELGEKRTKERELRDAAAGRGK